MAIDTIVKRYSVIGISFPPGVVPNSLKPRAWRQGVIGTYAGIGARGIWSPETGVDDTWTPEAGVDDTWTPDAALNSTWS